MGDVMKRKRLDRDVWWKHNKIEFPQYYQLRVDINEFHGLVGFIQLTDGQYHYWDLPITGKTAVVGKGMSWLQLIPDQKNRVITAIYKPDNSISVWYVDVIENIEHDTDGVIIFVDKYLDVCFTPQGEVIIDDRDELDEAYQTGSISKEQYDAALKECDLIIDELCSDIAETELVCSKILSYVYDRISSLNVDGE